MHTTLDFSRTSSDNALGRVIVFLLSLAADDAPQVTPGDQQNEREALRELVQTGLLTADALTPVAQTMQHAEAQHE